MGDGDELNDECVDESVDFPAHETSHSSLSETCPPQKSPRVTTSDLWDFFEKLPDADKKSCIYFATYRKD